MAVMNVVYVTVFLACYVIMPALAVPWKDCGSVQGKTLAVSVAGCDDKGICHIHKGVNATFGVDFTTNEDASGLKMLVYGHIAGVDVPFPIDNPDGCKGSNITCPVKSGQTYGYRNVIFVKPAYPSLTLVVKLKLVDQNNNVITCAEFPVEIDSSSLKLVQRGKSNSVRNFGRL